MAHSVFHLAVGVAAGGALLAPHVAGAWLRGRPLASPVARLLVVSYALGVLAVVPNLLARLGVAPTALDAPWMNVFVLHPLIDTWERGGLLIGELAIAAMFIGHYALILAAIAARRRR
jgi:hypothetical protein